MIYIVSQKTSFFYLTHDSNFIYRFLKLFHHWNSY